MSAAEKIEKLAKWLDFQFDGPQIGNQVRAIGERLASAEQERDEARAALATIREWAHTYHGGTKTPAEIWPGLADALAEQQ